MNIARNTNTKMALVLGRASERKDDLATEAANREEFTTNFDPIDKNDVGKSARPAGLAGQLIEPNLFQKATVGAAAVVYGAGAIASFSSDYLGMIANYTLDGVHQDLAFGKMGPSQEGKPIEPGLLNKASVGAAMALLGAGAIASGVSGFLYMTANYAVDAVVGELSSFETLESAMRAKS